MKIHAKVRLECTFLTIVCTGVIQRQTRNSRQMETESDSLHSSRQFHSPKTPLVSTHVVLNKHHFIWLTLPLAIKGPVHIPKTLRLVVALLVKLKGHSLDHLRESHFGFMGTTIIREG